MLDYVPSVVSPPGDTLLETIEGVGHDSVRAVAAHGSSS